MVLIYASYGACDSFPVEGQCSCLPSCEGVVLARRAGEERSSQKTTGAYRIYCDFYLEKGSAPVVK